MSLRAAAFTAYCHGWFGPEFSTECGIARAISCFRARCRRATVRPGCPRSVAARSPRRRRGR